MTFDFLPGLREAVPAVHHVGKFTLADYWRLPHLEAQLTFRDEVPYPGLISRD